MLTLHQFVGSHFNEKARWALDYKGLVHERVSYLPGPHMPVIKKLSGGPTTTPLLEHDGGYISGSAKIIEYLEARYPDLALYPRDERLRAEALAIQKRFDAEVGPATRTAVFSVFINEPAYLTATFARTKPWLVRLLYRASFPFTRPLIKRGNSVYPDNIARAIELSSKVLDEVGEMTAETGYLVGDSFTVADLTAASLFAPLASLEHPDMKRVMPVPQALTEFLKRWEGHATLKWVEAMYDKHRPIRKNLSE